MKSFRFGTVYVNTDTGAALAAWSEVITGQEMEAIDKGTNPKHVRPWDLIYQAKECYECGATVPELSPRSRCIKCEYKNAQFNREENDKLREVCCGSNS